LVPVVLLSESLNSFASRKGPHDTVTEQMLILSCDRCGEAVNADGAAILQESNRVIYSCPRDGAMLAQVGDDGWSTQGELTVRVGDEVVEWWNWMD
jgi:hypothetical protein